VDLKILRIPSGATHKKKRVGRGPSSGHGKTSTRGHKGQKSRGKVHPWFEGGQMPLTRRVPKRGFKPPHQEKVTPVNLGSLNLFESGSEINPEVLKKVGLIKGKGRKVKILGEGKVEVCLKVRAHYFSREATRKIIEAGGTAEVI